MSVVPVKRATTCSDCGAKFLSLFTPVGSGKVFCTACAPKHKILELSETLFRGTCSRCGHEYVFTVDPRTLDQPLLCRDCGRLSKSRKLQGEFAHTL